MGPAQVLFALREWAKKKTVHGVVSEKGGLTIAVVVSTTEILMVQTIKNVPQTQGHEEVDQG